jgi:hypothetical protein
MPDSPARRSSASARRRLQRRVLSEWRRVDTPPDLTGFERKVADVVGRIMRRAGVAYQLTREKIAADWLATVGEFLGKQSQPVALRRGVLTVAVLQAAVRYDLERRWKPDILARLRQRYGADCVKDVRFRN